MVLNEPLRDIESLEGLNPASNPIGIPVFFGPPSYLVFHPGFKSTFQQPDWLPLFGISIRAERLVQSMASGEQADTWNLPQSASPLFTRNIQGTRTISRGAARVKF